MADVLADKHAVRHALGAVAEATPATVARALARAYHPDATWRGSHPMNEAQGLEAIAGNVWMPLLHSFPDLERRDVILIGGSHAGHDFVACVGQYCGIFARDWLTIPATGRPVTLRYGEVHRVVAGRIAQSTVLIDVLDVIRQAGFWPVAPSLGTEGLWAAPFTGDGLVSTAQDPALSAASLAQTLRMQGLLGAHGNMTPADGRAVLLVPSQVEEWHPKMMWYGPCGIGTTRGMDDFVDHHRLPFRRAFHNNRGGQHYLRIGDGAYSATGGWPSVTADHLGDGFMGLGATGRPVAMRVMDFYLHHEGLIRENWVPIDIIDLLRQMGVDVFARMQAALRHAG